MQAPERVRPSLDELLDTASTREPFVQTDGKSGAQFERLTIDGQPYVLKHLSIDDDWIMRATGDYRCRPIIVWESGLLDQLPDSIDHGVVAAARTARGGALLMHDLSQELVPEGDEPLSLDQHLQIVDRMAELHAAFWGWDDDVGLTSLAQRYLEFCPTVSEHEALRGSSNPVPPMIGEGWHHFRGLAPAAAPIVLPLLAEIDPLVNALAATPQTFLHGDWKLGNIGSRADGRTILLDWAVPGAGPACSEITWYVALNRSRLPAGHDKDATFAAYRAALERHGVDTGSWWEAQLGLCMLGTLVQLGWEKTFGDPDELAWWEARAVEGAHFLP